MPKQKKCSYQIPRSSGTQGPPDTPPSAYDSPSSHDASHVSETPSGSSVIGSSRTHGPPQPDDCPFGLQIVNGARWKGKLVMFPNGKDK